jgi:predicted acyltransferase
MVFVNAPGAVVWPQLTHSGWNGLTVADVVFPMFLLAVGASLAVSRPPGWRRVARRVAALVVLGLIVNRVTFTGPLRYPGVLQRVALCYLVAAVTVRWPRKAVAWATLVLLVGYGAILIFGGNTPPHSVGAALDIDLFGRAHLYHQLDYDPEGLLSSLAATATVLLGYLAVGWLEGQARTARTSALFAGWAAALAAGGVALQSVVPINKRLWTPSFTLVTAGVALSVLVVLYAAVELARRPFLAWPFEVIGVNAVAVYVVSELGDAGLHRIKVSSMRCVRLPCAAVDAHTWLYQHWFASWAGARSGSLAFSLAFTVLLWSMAFWLWRAKVIVRV